ncbi:MAG: MBL fold metallo-hydrolase, partial [Candidatus Marinamargulisbacteria bacterium]
HLSALLNQLNGVNFPLSIHDLPAHITTTTDLTVIQKDTDLCIKTMPTNHHGDCIGYRIKNAVFDLCFFPDNQLYGLSDHQRSALIAFCQDTHLLIHDSQYIDSDMPQKKDWGHSRVQEAHALASQAKARQYALFHHDPGRHKNTILQLTKTLNQTSKPPISIAAYDGLELILLGN